MIVPLGKIEKPFSKCPKADVSLTAGIATGQAPTKCPVLLFSVPYLTYSFW
jgi:hypothetical protein